MIFSVDKSLFEKALSPVGIGIASRNTDPVLEGIYLEVSDNILTMCTYDLEKAIRTKIPVDAEKDGSIIIDSQKLIAIIHSMPQGEVTLEKDNNTVLHITSAESKFELLGIEGERFPNLPNVRGDITFTLPQNKMRKIISKTLFAVSSDDTKPIYTGSLFEICGNQMTVVALNGNRLAVSSEKGITETEDLSLKFIIPGKAQENLLRIMGDTQEPVTVEMARKHIIFTFDNIYFITRLLEGDFLDYSKKVPQQYNLSTTINRERWIESLERVSLLLDTRIRSSIKLTFSDNTLETTCHTEHGKVNDIFTVPTNNQSLEIGFNHRYLLEALKTIEDEEISANFSGPVGPVIITPVLSDKEKEESDYLHLILPVKLKD